MPQSSVRRIDSGRTGLARAAGPESVTTATLSVKPEQVQDRWGVTIRFILADGSVIATSPSGGDAFNDALECSIRYRS
jgi:hypothetical protein